MKGLALNNHNFILWNISAESYVMSFWKEKSKKTNLHKTHKMQNQLRSLWEIN